MAAEHRMEHRIRDDSTNAVCKIFRTKSFLRIGLETLFCQVCRRFIDERTEIDLSTAITNCPDCLSNVVLLTEIRCLFCLKCEKYFNRLTKQSLSIQK